MTENDSLEESSKEDQGGQLSGEVVRQACLSNASEYVKAASLLNENNQPPNIAYSLASLALEEVGKAIMFDMTYSRERDEDAIARVHKNKDQHEEKLFWAVWSEVFGKQVITRQAIEDQKWLVSKIYQTRLQCLCVDVLDNKLFIPSQTVTREYAANLIDFVEAKIEIEKSRERATLSPAQEEELKWFSEAHKDQDLRNFLYGSESMKKLAGFGNARDWIGCLRKTVDDRQAELFAAAQKELNRQRPHPDNALVPKWKMQIRFFTNSHTISPRFLNQWNQGVEWIKLVAVTGRRNQNQLIAEVTMSSNTLMHELYHFGWGISRRLAVALSIGSFGFFWWYVPQHISQYFDSIKDLETGLEVQLNRDPILAFNWGHAALTEQHLHNAMLCFSCLPFPQDREAIEPFNEYISGLTFLAKNDIHQQFEATAYRGFYLALKLAMKLYGDWDGASNYRPAYERYMNRFFTDEMERERFFNLGELVEVTREITEKITLIEVCAMKILTDRYLLENFKEQIEKKRYAF